MATKKNKDNKRDKEEQSAKDFSKEDPNQISDPGIDARLNSLDSNFSDLEILASEFSMNDESKHHTQPLSEDIFDANESSEEDYLNRLAGFNNDEKLTEGIPEEEEDFLKNRLELEAKTTPPEQKELELPEKIESPKELTSDNLNKDQPKKIVRKKKKVETLVDIEQSAELILSQSQDNEEFLEKLKSSLSEEEIPETNEVFAEKESVFTSTDEKLDDIDIIQALEQEINNADKATNPFINDQDVFENDDFLTNLDKLTIPGSPEDEISRDLNQVDETDENEFLLSSSTWKDLLELTNEEPESDSEKLFEFDSESPIQGLLEKPDEVSLPGESSFPMIDAPYQTNLPTAGSSDDNEINFTFEEEGAEDKESVDHLRQSFIDEFDQTTWDHEIEQKTRKKWFPRNIERFNHWFSSLSLAEKILIFLSFFISLAVIVSIFLVMSQWKIKDQKASSPPPAIEASDGDLVYPTGLQLPGGWFFFLQKGEIKDNRWEPQNAEWLANTKLRKVVAIPWSNQSEDVIKNLTTDDQISIFMNNNDVIVYQVDQVTQLARDNVRILSDTEPSLVVILFREDNQDRWTVIAKPKSSE